MPWTYEQSSGRLYRDGTLVQRSGGYSGKGTYRNDPNSQNVANFDPIPREQWHIGGYTAGKGPLTITLTPRPGTNTFGRSQFRTHGDNIAQPGAASEGCTIMSLSTRQMIVGSGDHDLEVVQ